MSKQDITKEQLDAIRADPQWQSARAELHAIQGKSAASDEKRRTVHARMLAIEARVKAATAGGGQ